jgi:Kdo2-lipid IVA lauroyltransferase/acyltransferase
LPLFTKWWWNRRETFGNQVFDRKGGFKEIVSRLRDGQDVGVLIDQNVKRDHATFIDFFNQKAATTKGLGLAIMRTGSPVVFGLSAPAGNNFYKLTWKRIIPSETGSLDDKINSILKQMHDILADFIRQYPEQWFWIHRRFKTKPEGVPEDTYSNI